MPSDIARMLFLVLSLVGASAGLVWRFDLMVVDSHAAAFLVLLNSFALGAELRLAVTLGVCQAS